MNALLNKYKWLKYAIGAFTIALGVTIIILACLSLGHLANVINIVVAVSLMIIGIIFICANLFSETHKAFTMALLIGTFSITAGVMLLVSKFHLSTDLLHTGLLVYFIAIFSLALGAALIAKAISMIYYRQKTALIVLMFVIATVAITAGILSLIFADSSQLQQSAYIILGVVLVALGIAMIIVSSIPKKEKE